MRTRRSRSISIRRSTAPSHWRRLKCFVHSLRISVQLYSLRTIVALTFYCSIQCWVLISRPGIGTYLFKDQTMQKVIMVASIIMPNFQSKRSCFPNRSKVVFKFKSAFPRFHLYCRQHSDTTGLHGTVVRKETKYAALVHLMDYTVRP